MRSTFSAIHFCHDLLSELGVSDLLSARSKNLLPAHLPSESPWYYAHFLKIINMSLDYFRDPSKSTCSVRKSGGCTDDAGVVDKNAPLSDTAATRSLAHEEEQIRTTSTGSSRSSTQPRSSSSKLRESIISYRASLVSSGTSDPVLAVLGITPHAEKGKEVEPEDDLQASVSIIPAAAAGKTEQEAVEDETRVPEGLGSYKIGPKLNRAL